MRQSISKNDNYIFNKFLRNYKNALQKCVQGQVLNNSDVIKVLNYLGYIDKYISQHSQQLVRTVCYMLSENRNGLVSKRNLFQFLRIISDVKKISLNEFKTQAFTLVNDNKMQNKEPLVPIYIGQFNQSQQWLCNEQQQKQVKQIFGSMNLKRISRQNIDAQNRIKQQNKQNQSFKPEILQKSRNMARQRFRKMSIDNKCKVQDRLIHDRSLKQSRVQQELNKSIQKQMKQCYFKPKINTPKRQIINYSLCKNIQSLNTSFQNKQNDKSHANIISHQTSFQSMAKSKASLIGDKLLIKGKQYQHHIQKLKDQYQQLNDFFQMKQCTFQPKILLKSHNYHIKPSLKSQKANLKCTKIRNAQKSIQRVKQARKTRQFQNQMKQRGYPQNVTWTKFINSYKSPFNTQTSCPILCIDLKIMNQTRNIKVFQGDNIDKLTQKICLQNSIPNQCWNRVEQLLKGSIDQCKQVKIEGQRIFLNR